MQYKWKRFIPFLGVGSRDFAHHPLLLPPLPAGNGQGPREGSEALRDCTDTRDREPGFQNHHMESLLTEYSPNCVI